MPEYAGLWSAGRASGVGVRVSLVGGFGVVLVGGVGDEASGVPRRARSRSNSTRRVIKYFNTKSSVNGNMAWCCSASGREVST